MYKFTFKINEKDIFNSTMNYNKSRITFLFDIVFTFTAIGVTLYNIINKSFFSFNLLYQILLIICCLLFPVIQPLLTLLKSIQHANKIKDVEITMKFTDDRLILSSSNETTEVLYENLYNFIKYKNMIVVMYDAIHGQIMPNRIFDNNKDEFYEYVASKIKYAREKQKEKNNE